MEYYESSSESIISRLYQPENEEVNSLEENKTPNSCPMAIDRDKNEEESLIPSNLLNESDIDLCSKNNSYNCHCFKQGGSNKQLKKANKTMNKNMLLLITKDYRKLFFESDVKLLISQLKNHQGSIYLQGCLTNLSESEIDSLLIRLCPFLAEIMCSHYGNYFMQKLFQKLSLKQRILIYNLIQYNFLIIATNKSGTYSIQSLIDIIKTPQDEKILQCLLCQNLLLLFCNENSHHIIQKIIIDFPEHKREYINNFLIDNLDKICINEFGSLCAIKFIIMNSNLNLRTKLVQSMEKHLYILLNNKHGCNTLLFAMEKYGNTYCSFLLNEIKQKLICLINLNEFIIPLIEKGIEILNKVSGEFANFAWQTIKNENAINFLMQNENGIKVLIALIKHFNSDQKNYFKIKNYIALIRDKQVYEIIYHLLI